MAPLIFKGLHKSNVESRAENGRKASACKLSILGLRVSYLTRTSAECNNCALIIECSDGEVEAGAKGIHETCEDSTN